MNILEALRAIGAVDPRMRLIAGGIGRNSALTKYVIGNGYRSAAGAGGNILIPEFTLDSLDLEPTFIKLHIEGREAAALESGKNTLTRCRPIIAATVYHERDNLLETSNFLFEHLQNYGYFFRCHSYVGTGAIIYAVPYERHLGNHRE